MSDKGVNIPITTTYLKGSGSVVSVVGPAEASLVATTPAVFSDSDSSVEYQLWGPNNDWAVVAREKIEASTTAYPLIAQKVSLMFGKGVTYYKEIRTAEGITHDFSPDPAIEEFFLNNDIDYLVMERLMDYKSGGNLWCEYILNNVYSAVATLNHLEGEFCRFGPVDKKTGKIDVIGFKSRWDKADAPAIIQFLHRKYFSKDEALLVGEIGKGRFSMHSALPSPGNTLYAIPPHAALFKEDGWLDFANNIPQLMHAINKNGMLLKYHIQIPSNYWGDKYPEWDNLDVMERSTIQETEFDLMDKFLKGTKNAGTSFISHFKVDPASGKSYDGWKIEELSDPIKKDQFLTSVQEADNQTARSIGMDSSMSNIQPQGGKMGAGSGSDKRVGMTNMVTMSYMDQYVILEPLRRVQVINGWDPRTKFIFINEVPTSLNENKSGVKSTLE